MKPGPVGRCHRVREFPEVSLGKGRFSRTFNPRRDVVHCPEPSGKPQE